MKFLIQSLNEMRLYMNEILQNCFYISVSQHAYLLTFKAKVLELWQCIPIRADSIFYDFPLISLVLMVTWIFPAFYKWRNWDPGHLSQIRTKSVMDQNQNPDPVTSTLLLVSASAKAVTEENRFRSSLILVPSWCPVWWCWDCGVKQAWVQILALSQISFALII